MSSRRVGYNGRTPIVVDEGPASVAVGSLAAVQNGGLPHLAVPSGGAGEVEISRIEVDEATRSAARAARTGVGGATADQLQASRMNGARRHIEVLAAAKAPRTAASYRKPPEESTMPDPQPKPLDTFQELSEAAAAASEAWARRQAAEIAWEAAQRALEAVLGEVEQLLHPAPARAEDDDGHVHQVISIDLRDTVTVAPAPELPTIGGGPAPRRQTREPRAPSGLTPRQAKAIELMRSGKTRADIARQMGTTYQTIDGLFEAAARKGLLPIELIPLLPARFAKYTGA